MERTLNILIVEDDTDVCTRFAEYAETISTLCVVGITNNSYRALDLVTQFQPDAVILDLELNHGQGNGLLFLQELKESDICYKPYILVTTNNSSSTTYDYARQLGADFIMSKHKEDYSEEGAIDFLVMMKKIIQSSTQQNTASTTTETPIQYERRTKKRIAMEIDKLGINPNATGYKYLIDAIFLAINGQENNLCITLGQTYSKTYTSVERASQNAINRAWARTPIEELKQYYTATITSAKGVPTLNEFVFFYANKIKNGY